MLPVSGAKMAGTRLRPCEPGFCYREIVVTGQAADLAGFSETGLKVAGKVGG